MATGVRKVAASFQQPRTLDSYRQQFAQSRANKEGFLEIKCVARHENPNDIEWERKYVVFREGIVSLRREDDAELVTLVHIEEVLVVKTARSTQSRTIISMTTEQGAIYLHAQSEDDMRDWLFCLHVAVMYYILDCGISDFDLNYERDLESRASQAMMPSRQALAGRSQSGDGNDTDPRSRLWSETGNDLDSAFSAVKLVDTRAPSPNGPLFSSVDVPTVDGRNGSSSNKPLGNLSALNGKSGLGQQQQRQGIGGTVNRQYSFSDAGDDDYVSGSNSLFEYSEDRNGLDRIATRDFSFVPLSPGGISGSRPVSTTSPSPGSRMASATPPLHPKTPSGQSGGYPIGSPRSRSISRPSPLDPYGNSTNIFGSPLRSPNFISQQRRSSSSYCEPIESSKRLFDPPVELDGPSLSPSPSSVSSSSIGHSGSYFPASPNSHANGLLGFRSRETQPTLGASTISPPPAPEPVAVPPPIASKGRYIPPHLREGYSAVVDDLPPVDDEDESTRRRESYFDRSSNFSDSGDLDESEGLFAMEHNGNAPGLNGRQTNLRDEPSLQNNEQGRFGHLFGKCAEQGCRSSMEDFDLTVPRVIGTSIGLYGVFDGHCGTRVAELASQRLEEYTTNFFTNSGDWFSDIEQALNQAFAQIEEDFFKLAIEANPSFQDGSCALVAAVHYPEEDGTEADCIAIANIGDSRAVLYHHGRVEAVSIEHSPSRSDEYERITKAGGWVTVEREMLIEKLHRMDLNDPEIRAQAKRRFNYVETSRVNGELAVSRALGDIDYKKPAQDSYRWFFPRDHQAFGHPDGTFEFGESLVKADAEWRFINLNAGLDRTASAVVEASNEEDEDQPNTASADRKDVLPQERGSFLIIACDGLWDALTNEEAVEICKACTSPQDASKSLVDFALRLGTSDNVTALVIALSNESFPSTEILGIES